MDARIRLSQLYELQREALINVHYYAGRVSHFSRLSRSFQIVAALAASGTIASVVRDVPPNLKLVSIAGSVIAAVAASIVAVWNFSDSLARSERMHAAYKMLYHSTETLAKQTIGADALTKEQDALLSMLEAQLAALGPQDEVDPNLDEMRKAREVVQRQLPDSYYYPQSA
jgi:acyl-[acyl carrier protein]--UDP-N-acetylglucosamine O-acyltransferase